MSIDISLVRAAHFLFIHLFINFRMFDKYNTNFPPVKTR